MPVEVIQEFIAPGRPNRPGSQLQPTSVTIHNTDNARRGAGAKNHSAFVRNVGYYVLNGRKHPVSWHYTVDDMYIIQQLPLNERAWHAGPGNVSSVAVEICMNPDMNATLAYQNAAALVASLVRDMGLSRENVVTHQSWTGKTCPRVLLEGSRWETFLDMVGAALQSDSLRPGIHAGLNEALTAPVVETTDADETEHDIDHELLAEAVSGEDEPK